MMSKSRRSSSKRAGCNGGSGYWLHGIRHIEGKTLIRAQLRKRRTRMQVNEVKTAKARYGKPESNDTAILGRMKP